jgi:thymidylate synthase (FAD)
MTQEALVEPQVFLVGETRVVKEGLDGYLQHLGLPDWKTDAVSDAEALIEVMGRLCYRSFAPGLNPNVSRIRESNADYLANILAVKHGSVIEHPVFNFIFTDVSRVFTHELVRHRVGTAISQESLRFVRIQKLDGWIPTVIKEDEGALSLWYEAGESLDKIYRQFEAAISEHFALNHPGTPFRIKKTVTSALRRMATNVIPTTIGWSVNPRTLRWVIEMRTDPAAEEEIRLVFGKVGEIVIDRYPALFGDFEIEVVDGLPWYRALNSKV